MRRKNLSNDERKLKLSDLVNIELLQKFQDAFAKAMGVACATIDENGLVTKPSNNSAFCEKLIRSNQIAFAKCKHDNIENGKLAFKKNEPVIYTCHAGLTNFIVPIIVNGLSIASILGGQVFLGKPDENKLKNLAKGFRILDEKEYVKALRQVKIHSPEHIKMASEVLFIVANVIADNAYKNLKLKEKNEKEQFSRKIIDAIRSSLNLEEVLSFICKETAKFFNVQRTTISEVPKTNHGKVPNIRMEFKTIPELEGADKLIYMKEISGYYSEILKEGKILIIDNVLESDTSDYFKESYERLGVKSILAIPIQKKESKWGILILSEYNNYRHWTEEEIELAESIADQIYSAIKNAELYELEKKTATRENLLRRITETIRSSLDINKIKNTIVEEISKSLDANRCFIIEYDKAEDKFLPVENEYLSSEDIKSAIGFDLNKEAKELEDMNRKGKEVILPDVEKFLEENNLHNTPAEKHFKEYSVKSGFSIPFFYKEDMLGLLVIHYTTHKKSFTNDEVELIRTLASQIAIALHQAQMYKNEKNIASREIILRETIKVIRSTLDTEKVKKYFLEIACNYFNADRCIFDEYDNEQGKFLPFQMEILKGEGLKSLINVSVEDDFPEFAAKLKYKKRNIIIKDVQKTLSRKALPNYKSIQTLHNSDAKSDYGFIVQYKDEILGILILHYVKNKRILTFEELEFLKMLRDQAGIALHQAELYEKEKKTVQRENLLREITEKIRSSLNLDETLEFICNETAKLFNVQRTAITTFPNPNDYKVFTVRKEYKYWENMEGFGFREDSAKTAAYWAEVLIDEGQVLAIDNIETADLPNYFKNTYQPMGIKSVMGVSIKRGKDAWGTLILAEYNNLRHWDEEEKTLLRTIANQIYIAINQAELFETSQKKAQNEKALREIMLASVQTFEMKAMLKSLVTESGKLFEADRCFFIEVDTETNTNLPIQDYAEYRSSDDIISHTTRSPKKEETSNFIERTRQKKFEYSVDVSKSPIPEATKKMLVEDLGVKSYLIAPVFYGDICYGAFVFHYVRNYKQFTQDEIDMAIAVANQSAVILHQAELFELTKIQAEREKISKNIIEILRSTLDRSIIRRLFVKNIGQFLGADRVMFSEFNQEAQMYNPVIPDSEYLSSPDIKSLVGFDWSIPGAQEYLQPLLERREFHIFNWGEYLQGTNRSQEFIEFFENRNVKSSYSFPVMYQQRIMGFFSISFVKKIRRLTEEDINRVRNICTQAGIALYHAYLYEEAQKSVQKHDEFVNELSDELKTPLNMIVEFSEMESEHEIECAEELEHLSKINVNAKRLLYFLEDITKNITKLNLE